MTTPIRLTQVFPPDPNVTHLHQRFRRDAPRRVWQGEHAEVDRRIERALRKAGLRLAWRCPTDDSSAWGPNGWRGA